jgi:hypothetical protein
LASGLQLGERPHWANRRAWRSLRTSASGGPKEPAVGDLTFEYTPRGAFDHFRRHRRLLTGGHGQIPAVDQVVGSDQGAKVRSGALTMM